MGKNSLLEILESTTKPHRKGSEVLEELQRDASIEVTQVMSYTHTREAPSGTNFEKVDMIFFDVTVNKGEAVRNKAALIKILDGCEDLKTLRGGPSYIALAGLFEFDQESALRLMALGSTLRLWDILHAKNIAQASDEETLKLAGSGFLMISGYTPSTVQTERPRSRR